MEKISLETVVKRLFEIEKESGKRYTLLGIGPMSESLTEAVFTLAKRKDFPIMFIASRNQVDADEFGRGYVCNWDQKSFKADINAIAKRCGFGGLYYLCRDHGGPWQRDEERSARLPVEKAMELGKKSFIYDLEAGFDLLHIDPTKIPTDGGPAPMELILDMTEELISFCEAERRRLGLTGICYEVGTEETDGGFTSVEKYEQFINTLVSRLKDKNLPLPVFIVGNTGTLTRLTENVGNWSAAKSAELSAAARKHSVGLKEHNADYLPDNILNLHPAIGITAANVAPEYGVVESKTLLMLSDIEMHLFEEGFTEKHSDFRNVFTKAAVYGGRWVKWMTGEEKGYTPERVLEDDNLSRFIAEIGGHYSFNNDDVKAERQEMYQNLADAGLDPHRIVINALISSVERYVDAFNMEGLTSKVAEGVRG